MCTVYVQAVRLSQIIADSLLQLLMVCSAIYTSTYLSIKQYIQRDSVCNVVSSSVVVVCENNVPQPVSETKFPPCHPEKTQIPRSPQPTSETGLSSQPHKQGPEAGRGIATEDCC